MEELVVFTFPYQANGNHVKMLSAVDNIIITTPEKSFNFSEIINNYRLKLGTVCQIVTFI